jgi:hypothetical protein
MDFEEFFRKKRIDLAALGKAEPALLSEFKTHFEQMGEKSFDHTKKYWFNKLRLIYHLAPEPKVEKVVIENRLAEQTITEALSETTPPPANAGFKPRFKPEMAKPAETPVTEAEKPAESVETPAPSTPSVGFKPRFKAGLTRPAETSIPETEKPAVSEDLKTPPTAPIGFNPRFKAGITKPTEAEQKEETRAEPSVEGKPTESIEPKPTIGFKPRFNMKNMKPKGEE